LAQRRLVRTILWEHADNSRERYAAGYSFAFAMPRVFLSIPSSAGSPNPEGLPEDSATAEPG